MLVGVLTSLVAPWAPLAFGAILTVTVVTAFALHPTGRARAITQPGSPSKAGRAFTPEIAAHLGEVLWASGAQDEARKVFAEAAQRDADNEALRETMGRLKVKP